MRRHLSVYVVVDPDEDPEAATRVVETMSRMVAGFLLDGRETGMSVIAEDDEGGEGIDVAPEPSDEPAES